MEKQKDLMPVAWQNSVINLKSVCTNLVPCKLYFFFSSVNTTLFAGEFGGKKAALEI